MNADSFIKGTGESKGRLILKVDMDELLEFDSGRYDNRDHHVMICPMCKSEKSRKGNPNYSKRKLFILKDHKAGYCCRCNTIYVPYFDPDPDRVILRLPEFKLEDEDSFEEVDTVPDIYKGGMKYYHEAPDLSDNLIEFLSNRRSSAVVNHLSELKFKAYSDEEIIIPFFWDSEPFFYQINYCHPKSLKYFTPPVKHKPLYMLRKGSPILVLCEGIYDAIACLDIYPTCTIAAILGSAVTSYQAWMIRTLLPSQIIVYLDDSKLSINVVNQLKSYPLGEYCNITYVSSDGEDPDEYLKRIERCKE